MTTLPTTNAPTIELSSRAKLEILGAILLALFLFALDQTVVGTALPVIVTDLNGNSLYTWVVTIYLLTATISGPIYGRLSDFFGRRPIIIFAVSLFLIGSVLCGLSQEMWQLILFRGIQGLGGGAIFPVSLAVVADLYTPAERGKYLGLFGAVFGLSSLIGPAIGGIITDTVGWHWIFFVNVPLGLISLVDHLAPPAGHPPAGRRAQHRLRRRGGLRPGHHAVPDRAHQQADRRVGRSRGRWADPGRAGDRRRSSCGSSRGRRIRSCRWPCSGSGTSRSRSPRCSWRRSGSSARSSSCRAGSRPSRGASATESGYSILPLLLGLIVSATASGQIVARTGHYKVLMLGSLLLLALGLFMLTNLTAETDRLVLSFWMLLTGLGIGPSFAVFTLVVQNSVAAARIGVATGSLTFFQQIGGTIGLTLAGTVLANRLVTEIPIQLVAAGVPKPIVDEFAGGTERGHHRDGRSRRSGSWPPCRPRRRP